MYFFLPTFVYIALYASVKGIVIILSLYVIQMTTILSLPLTQTELLVYTSCQMNSMLDRL